jgi:hypothetical protein
MILNLSINENKLYSEFVVDFFLCFFIVSDGYDLCWENRGKLFGKYHFAYQMEFTELLLCGQLGRALFVIIEKIVR